MNETGNRLESLTRIAEICLSEGDLQPLMQAVLEVLRNALGADRAWIAIAAESATPRFEVPFEATADAWPGVRKTFGGAMDMSPAMAARFHEILQCDAPQEIRPAADGEALAGLMRWQVQRILAQALPANPLGQALLGLHRCAADRGWNPSECRFFSQVAGLLARFIQCRERNRDLLETENRYRLLVENSNDLVVKTDPEGRLLFVSPSYCRLFDKREDELIGRAFIPLVHEEDRAATLSALAELSQPPHTVYMEQRAMTRHGWRWLAWSDRAVLNQDHEIQAVVGIGRDIHRQKMTEFALKREQAKARHYLDIVGVMVVAVNAEGRVELVNRRACEILGYTAEELTGADWFSIGLPESWRGQVRTVFGKVMRGEVESVEFFENPVRTRSGEERLIAWRNSNLYDAAGRLNGVLSSGEDITVQRRREEGLRQAAAVFENTAEGILITDAERRIVKVNPAFHEITGYRESEVLGQNPSLFASGHHDADYYRTLWCAIENQGRWQGEIWNRRKNGETYPLWMNISRVLDDQQRVSHYVAVFSDISSIKANQGELERLAHYDPLTNLPNRLLFKARVAHAIQRARRGRQSFALLFIDLDRFKQVNDRFGHAAGDRLLTQVATRFGESVREEDTLARLGGDEFVLLAEELSSPEQAGGLARKLAHALEPPFQSDGHRLEVGCSIGISLYPDDGMSVTELLKSADRAMYRAKSDGRNHYQFCGRGLSGAAFEHATLERLMRQGLERHEFFLQYQPQLLQGRRRVAAVEALIRWRQPQMGRVYPDRFMPTAEENGLIVPIGEWMLREACAEARRWLDQGLSFDQISLNLSPAQLRDPGFSAMLRSALQDTDLPPERLELEIVENLLGSPELEVQALRELAVPLGIRLAVNNFGAGCSSLVMLSQWPVRRLKIDPSFIGRLPAAAEDARIVRAMLALGRALDLQVVAEGAETAEQRRFLEQARCPVIQGDCFSPPLDASDAACFLRDFS